MKTITISVKTLEELIAISDDYLAGEHKQPLNEAYYIGKRDAYKNILDTFSHN